MSGILVSMGDASMPLWQSMITALSPAVVAALAALGGVALTNDAIARHRREDERRQKAQREMDASRDRGLAALMLADHFEDFVLVCIRVVDSFWGVEWTTPYQWDENIGVEPQYLSDLPPWPALVDWRLLGFDSAVEATNFRRRVELIREALRDGSVHETPDDYHTGVADAAAALGLEAWDIALRTRIQNDLGQFKWPDGWSGVERFRDHIARREKIRAAQAEAAVELFSGSEGGQQDTPKTAHT
jgi:hypothetical protein